LKLTGDKVERLNKHLRAGYLEMLFVAFIEEIHKTSEAVAV
jgi:hypothetical protein